MPSTGSVEQRLGVPYELVPVLDEVGAAGVQEAHLGVGVDRRAAGQRLVQLGDMAAVEPVGGVGEQQIAAGLQHRLHPPAQPVPGVEGASVAGALLAEAVAVAVHPQQRDGGVGAQRVQTEPGVGHRRVEPHRGPELLLGLRIGAHGVGVDRAQPGEFGRGGRALVPISIPSPHKTSPRGVPPGECRPQLLEPAYGRRELTGAARTSVRVLRWHRLASYLRFRCRP